MRPKFLTRSTHLKLIVVLLAVTTGDPSHARVSIEELISNAILSSSNARPISAIEDIIRDKAKLLDISFLSAKRLVRSEFGVLVEEISVRYEDTENFADHAQSLVRLIRADLPPEVSAIVLINREEVRYLSNRWSVAFWREPDGSFLRFDGKPIRFIRKRLKRAESEYMEQYWRIFEGLYLAGKGRHGRAIERFETVWASTHELDSDPYGLSVRSVSFLAQHAVLSDDQRAARKHLPRLARTLHKYGVEHLLGSVFFGWEPQYPEVAILADRSGRVVVKVEVDRFGNAVDAVVVSETPGGFEFGEAAREAVLDWKYVPKVDEQGSTRAFTVQKALLFDIEQARQQYFRQRLLESMFR